MDGYAGHEHADDLLPHKRKLEVRRWMDWLPKKL